MDVATGDDPYKILGITNYDATEADIKKAYRKLALKHHPDKNPNDPNAHATFAKISNAYELLTNEEERAYYDYQHGHGRYNPNRGGGGGDVHGRNPSGNTKTAFWTSTTTSRPSSSSNFASSRPRKPTSHTFHDPFSVFEEVFREEFGNMNMADDFFGKDVPTKKNASSTNDDGEENPLPIGAKEIGMQTAMKTINGKSVTVTERIYELPDGSTTTRIEKKASATGKTTTSNRNPAPSLSQTRRVVQEQSLPHYREQKQQTQQPILTTKIVNGIKETTIEYPDGRSETKCEPVDDTATRENTNKPTTATVKPKKKQQQQAGQTRTTTKIANGMKETTTHYPDGRKETSMESVSSVGGDGLSSSLLSPRKSVTTSSSTTGRFPSKMTMKNPFNNNSKTKKTANTMMIRPAMDDSLINDEATSGTSSSSTMTSTSQSTKIVNGKKITTIKYTTTKPDGSTETRTEQRVESC